jgi:hypothetical protein
VSVGYDVCTPIGQLKAQPRTHDDKVATGKSRVLQLSIENHRMVDAVSRRDQINEIAWLKKWQ